MPISINNSDFQAPFPGAWTTNVPGWDTTGLAGVWNGQSLPTVPAGGRVGFANAGGSLSQDLAGVTVSETGVVEISMEFHGRFANVTYEITLEVNGVPIPAIAITGSAPAPGTMTTETFSFDMSNIPGVAGLVGQQVGLVISNAGGTQVVFDNISGTFDPGTPICFCRGVLIETEFGPVAIEDLEVGDSVATLSSGLQPIRWIGKRHISLFDNPANLQLCPVRISQGALGNGLPKRDLLVSRQHRILVQSKIARRMFGTKEVLIPAIKLTELPGIYVDRSVDRVEYHHLLFDRHEIISAEGVASESLFTGPEALKSVGADARKEILRIFPTLATLGYSPDPVCYIPVGKFQRKLVARHLKNNQPVNTIQSTPGIFRPIG